MLSRAPDHMHLLAMSPLSAPSLAKVLGLSYQKAMQMYL